MRSTLLLAALLAFGCDSSKTPADAAAKKTEQAEKPEEDAPRPPSPQDACDAAHGERVRALLEQQCAFVDASVPAGLVEVDRAPKAVPDDAIEIDLPSSGNLQVAGRSISPAGWDTRLGQELGRAADAKGINARPALALRIGASNARSRVAALLEQLDRMGFIEAFIVVSSKDRLDVPAPLDAALAEELQAQMDTLPAQRAVVLAKRMEQLVAGCEPAQKAFAAVSTAPADQRCGLLSRGIADAMLACDCPKEEAELLTALHVMTVEDSDGSLGVAIRVRLDRGQSLPASPKSTDERPTWADVVAALDLSKEPVVLGTQK